MEFRCQRAVVVARVAIFCRTEFAPSDECGHFEPDSATGGRWPRCLGPMQALMNPTESARAHHRTGHISATGVYPANLCPLSSGIDFACFGEDFGQSVGESIKAAPGRAVWQGTPEHLDGVLREQEGIGNTIQACPG